MEGEGELGGVGHEHAEHVAGSEAARGQARGDARDAGGERGVAQRAAARRVDQGGLVAQRCRPAEHELMQRDVRQRDVGIRALEDHADRCTARPAAGQERARPEALNYLCASPLTCGVYQ